MTESRAPARLFRLPFSDPDRAATLLCGDALRWWDTGTGAPVDEQAARIIAELGRAADPHAALAAVANLCAAADGARLRDALGHDEQLRLRLIRLLGASDALAEQLLAHPQDWSVLCGDYDAAGVGARLARAVGADPDAPVTGSAGTPATLDTHAGAEQLRRAYRRELAGIAGRDLSGEFGVRQVTELLADLAGHTVQAAMAVAATQLEPADVPYRLAVVAMGKTGGRELNYVSDVDVVFVAEPQDSGGDVDAALAAAAALAGATIRVCGAAAWQVDAALRPEGKDGPLVRTLASHQAYYRRWASTWEFQALLKARPLAGDLELAERYCEAVAPLVWSAAERADFVADVQAMRRRVVATLPADVAPREIKLGRGGLRDVEFAVQLLQLVHGRGDDALRVAGTLRALAALRDGGYVGRDDARSLIDAYRFLRVAEHRLQLRRLRRTHILPGDPQARAWLARAMGYRAERGRDALAVFEGEWARHTREVRRLHEKLFYRPLLEAVARVPSQDLRLTTTEAGRRLAALGFADPNAALRHIEALTAGLSRRAALQRTLLPVLLSDFADAPDPDAGLLAYRQVSDQLGTTPWYLRLLRDEGTVTTRLAYLLGTSRYVARMLGRVPEALALLAGDEQLRLRGRGEVVAAMRDAANRQDDSSDAMSVVLGLRRQELLRVAFADLLGRADLAEVCEAISATTEATLQVALQIAFREVAARHGAALPLRLAVIALGRLGGAEAGYGSDADVLFVFEPDDDAPGDVDPDPDDPDDGDSEDATQLAHDVAARMRALLAVSSPSDPPLHVDADLRPEGRAGPLVRSLASYARYYARWSAGWEAQALLRARFVAGDAELGSRFMALVDAVRYPQDGLSTSEIMEIRRLKGRVDAERLPRGADPAMHTKLGRGGLVDIEWTIQLLQLAHGAAVPGLQTTRTLPAIRAAVDAGFFSAEDASALVDAWRRATRVRNAIMLVRDKPGDQLPHPGRELVAVGRAMGYPADFEPGQLIDDYRRSARRARRVVEQTFYGPPEGG